jgi:omega-6 fatty acid desaturase (delta-12 desaturase)
MLRLFLIGHDACHGSFTTSKMLNQWIGRLAFLPTMTTFRCWAVTHNMLHHGFTNLTSEKDTFSPISIDDYKKLSTFGKFKYRVYRHYLGLLIYYLIEVWWKYFYFPKSNIFGENVSKWFLIDSILVTFFSVVWCLSLYSFAADSGQNFHLLLILGFIVPFLLAQMTISFLIYLNHTHPKVRWYDNKTEWIASMPLVSSSIHVRFSFWASKSIYNLMEHTAHHLNMKIPCYNLREAQRKLEELCPKYIVVQDFSWRWYLECTRICKLYDFEKHEWVQFPK